MEERGEKWRRGERNGGEGREREGEREKRDTEERHRGEVQRRGIEKRYTGINMRMEGGARGNRGTERERRRTRESICVANSRVPFQFQFQSGFKQLFSSADKRTRFQLGEMSYCYH